MENESVDGIYGLTTLEETIYNVSNHIFYNYGPVPGDVLVQIDKKQNTTIAPGYYSIAGLTNHTNNPIINTIITVGVRTYRFQALEQLLSDKNER